MAQPTLNDLLATILVVRTLIIVCALPPFIFFVSPFLLGVLISLLNTITFGYGVFSLGGTTCLILAGRATIVSHAPSAKKAQDALDKSTLALPLVCYVAFQLILHFILVPLFRLGGIESQRVSPTPDLLNTKVVHFTSQLAGGLLFMGLSIVSRYYGPASIMRCSAFPLISRPVVGILRSLIARCVSGEGIFILLAAPSDTPGGLIYTPSYQPQISKGRRYQGPEVQTTGLILVSTHIFTYMASNICTWDYAPATTHMFVMTGCVTAFLHTMFTCIDGQSHELNPPSYRNRIKTFWTIPQLSKYLKSIVCSAALVPTVYYLAVVWGTATEDLDWSFVAISFLASIFFNVYLSTIDFASRFFLCASGFSMKRLISEVVADPSPDIATEVIVHSLVMGDPTLFQSITRPTPKLGTNYLEEEELLRSKENSDKLALLLTKKSHDQGLAGDMLRVVILESFGGKNTSSNNQVTPSPRHEETIKAFFTMSVGTTEPMTAPIVRVLCAYAAGLGGALQALEKPNKQSLTPAGFETWALPPGALNCSEQAIIGATRCIIHSIRSKTSADWRSTQLSMFVPVVLMAAFKLRSGLSSFEKANPNIGQCMQVQSTCDACAHYLLETLQSVADSSIVELTIQDKDCRAWLDNLLSQIGTNHHSGNAANPPVLILENDRPISQYNKGGFALKYY